MSSLLLGTKTLIFPSSAYPVNLSLLKTSITSSSVKFVPRTSFILFTVILISLSCFSVVSYTQIPETIVAPAYFSRR